MIDLKIIGDNVIAIEKIRKALDLNPWATDLQSILITLLEKNQQHLKNTIVEDHSEILKDE